MEETRKRGVGRVIDWEAAEAAALAQREAERGAFALSVPVTVYRDGEDALTIRARGAAAAVHTLAGIAANAFAERSARGGAREVTREGKRVSLWRSPRILTDSEREETAAAYHGEAARAFAHSGMVPSWAQLFHVRRGSGLSFAVLIAWRRALRAGSKRARSLLYGGGAEKVQIESLSQPVSAGALEGLANLFARRSAHEASEAEGFSQGDEYLGELDRLPCEFTLADAPIRNSLGGVSSGRVDRERLARWVSWAGWALRAFHAVSGSREWRSGLARDLRLVGAIAALARGAGVEVLARRGMANLLHESGGACSDSLRKRAHDLRKRLAAGDLLLTNDVERVALALTVQLGARRGGAAAREIVGKRIRGTGNGGAGSIVSEIRAALQAAEAEQVALAAANRVETLPDCKPVAWIETASTGAFVRANGQRVTWRRVSRSAAFPLLLPIDSARARANIASQSAAAAREAQREAEARAEAAAAALAARAEWEALPCLNLRVAISKEEARKIADESSKAREEAARAEAATAQAKQAAALDQAQAATGKAKRQAMKEADKAGRLAAYWTAKAAFERRGRSH